MSESGGGRSSNGSKPRVRAGGLRTGDDGALERTIADPDTIEQSSIGGGPGEPRRGSGGWPPGSSEQSSIADSSPAALDATAFGPIPLGSNAHPVAAPGAEDSEQRAALAPFGPYARVEVLAEQGSIGLVARGHNESFGRWELLKFLRAELGGEVELVRQFKREGRMLAQLSHPNVVQVFATYEVLGQTCLAMEFLDGESLEAFIRAAGPLSAERGRELLMEAARGLAAAHEVGLLHRDVKPANLFVTSRGAGRTGGLKLIDFGLATADARRATERDQALVSAASGGTPIYMAPELWAGQDATPRSDLYALGLTFASAFAGEHPLGGLSFDQLRRRIADDQPFPSLAVARPDLPAPLVAIVDRLCAKKPDERFASADELLATLVEAAEARARTIPAAGPYPGLEPFGLEAADVFFGREREVAEIVERLRRQPAVVLVGPAGCGKTSLAVAGVARAVQSGALGGALVHAVARVTADRQPSRALAVALAKALGGDDAERLLASIGREPARLGEEVLARLDGPRACLVVVDGLERALDGRTDARDLRAFARGVAALAEASSDRIRLVITVRAEAVDRAFAIDVLHGLVTRSFHPVRPLAGDALRRALVEPARVAGYRVDSPAALDEIEDEVRRSPLGLALAGLGMAEWWKRRDEARKLLAQTAWSELGGLAGALAIRADAAVAALEPEERAAADGILLRLAGSEGAGNAVSRAALEDPAVSGAAGPRTLKKLLAAKVVVESAGRIELGHEALPRASAHLKSLLATPDDAAFQRRVAEAAREWDLAGRRETELWSGTDASRLARWFAATRAPLGQVELAFVEAVGRRNVSRRSTVRIGSGVAAIVAAVLAVAVVADGKRTTARLEAASRELEATKKQSDTETRKILIEAALAGVERSPRAALRDAQRARELGNTSDLDAIGWRALAAGIPRALPKHEIGLTLGRFSPDGSMLATSAGAAVRLLAAHGPWRRELTLAGAEATAIAFSPDSKRLFVGTDRGRVLSANLPGGALREVMTCEGAVLELSAAREKVLATCRVRTATQLAREGGPSVPVLAAHLGEGAEAIALVATKSDALEPLEQEVRFVEAGGDATLVARDGNEALLGRVNGQAAPVSPGKAAESPTWRDLPGRELALLEGLGGRWLSLDATGRAALLDRGLDPVAVLDDAGSPVVRVPSRRAVALAGPDNAVLVVALDSGAVLARLFGATKPLSAIAVDPAGDWLVTTARDGGVRGYALDEMTPRALGGPGTACAPSADGAGFACVASRTLRIAPATQGPAKTAREVKLDGEPREGLAAARGIGGAAYRDADGRVVRVDDAGAAPISETRWSTAFMAFARGSDLLAVTGEADSRTLLEIARAKGQPASSLTLSQGSPTSIAVSADGAQVLVGHAGGAISVVDAATATLTRTLAAFKRTPVTAVVQEGARIAAANDAGRVVLLAAGDASEPDAVTTVYARVRCLAFAGEGRALVVGGDRGARLVDIETRTGFELLPIGVASCARGTGDGVVLVDLDGGVWRRTLHLDADVATFRMPAEALDQSADSQWKGLVSDDRR